MWTFVGSNYIQKTFLSVSGTRNGITLKIYIFFPNSDNENSTEQSAMCKTNEIIPSYIFEGIFNIKYVIIISMHYEYIVCLSLFSIKFYTHYSTYFLSRHTNNIFNL